MIHGTEYTVIYEQDANGWGATVPDLDCFAVADDFETVKRDIAEAIRLNIEARRERGYHVPAPTTLSERLMVSA